MGLFRNRKQQKRCRVSAVIVAGGSSSRMNGVNKLLIPLGGIPVLRRTLAVFEAAPEVDEIVLVLREGGEAPLLQAAGGLTKLSRIVHGGATRTESARNGVLACAPESEIILIHDAARPLLTGALIRRAVEAAGEWSAAVPVLPVTDTVKRVEDGFVAGTPDRASLFAAQTPQAFRSALIRAALEDAVSRGISLTDDSAAAERLGMRVHVFDGEADNLKITVPADVLRAEAVLKEREGT